MVTPILPMYINRNIITLGEMINEINFPTIAGGFLNNVIIKDRIPKQVLKGIEMCRIHGINLVANNDLVFTHYLRLPGEGIPPRIGEDVKYEN